MLLSQPGHAALRDALLTADRVGARAAVRVLVSEADLDPEPLLAAGDPIVRLLLLRRLQAGETERPVPILERLARDRFPPIAAGALDLLARADPDLVRLYLRHRTARVRRAALRALVRADRSDVTTFVGALADDSPGVTKTALAALWRRPRSVAVQDLARLATDPREHVQRAAARLSGLRQYRVQRGFRPVWDAPDP